VRFLGKLLLVNILVACGAPGSDAVFKPAGATAAAVGTASNPASVLPPPPPPPARRATPKTFAGYFRLIGNIPQFQPCGTSRPLDVYGASPAMRRLKERIRFGGYWEGAKLFAQLQGAVATDTVRDGSTESDSIRPGPRTRFNLVDVDSLRTWRSSDCGGMRVS
jgi:hypothetical protein